MKVATKDGIPTSGAKCAKTPEGRGKLRAAGKMVGTSALDQKRAAKR